MNMVILMGRLTRDPEIRYGQQSGTAVARYTLAVDRRFKKDGDEATADFFNLVSFGKQGEFVEKYLHKGTKIVVVGEMRNNNYTNRDGQKVYGIDIVTSSVEFAESRAASERNNPGDGYGNPAQGGNDSDGFMPTDDDGDLPF